MKPSPQENPSVRLDKWLWATRFFKTRALAADACELGRIESNGTAPNLPVRSVSETI